MVHTLPVITDDLSRSSERVVGWGEVAEEEELATEMGLSSLSSSTSSSLSSCTDDSSFSSSSNLSSCSDSEEFLRVFSGRSSIVDSMSSSISSMSS